MGIHRRPLRPQRRLPATLLRFLAEMLHPVVRRDPAEVQRLAGKLNDLLAADGFELYPAEYISGLPVYAGGSRATFHGARPDWKFESRPLLTDPRVLHEHQERIRAGLERDPAAAIASCKELVEACARSSWNVKASSSRPEKTCHRCSSASRRCWA
ncbi:hypothetical protein ACFYO5_36220 [Streptomyces sp. NPDC006259]|uniref:AbiJ-related protein n=1 Tax=Streptomyces sp. NPDC006259 TaxID=3364740 RepID=UPI00369EE6B6